MLRTPHEEGIKKGTVIGPEDGWKARTYYVVEVAGSKNNIISKHIFYSGFLTDDKPAGYNCILSPRVDGKPELRSLYYLKVLEELDINLGDD